MQIIVFHAALLFVLVGGTQPISGETPLLYQVKRALLCLVSFVVPAVFCCACCLFWTRQPLFTPEKEVTGEIPKANLPYTK